jgi:hypothetical protein
MMTPCNVPPLPLHLVKNIYKNSPVNNIQTEEMTMANYHIGTEAEDSQVNYDNLPDHTNEYSNFSNNIMP